jgi:hypothetical protein
MRQGGYVVTTFPIPPLAPKPVLEAYETFERLVGEYADVRSQILEAQELKAHEIRQAGIKAAQARIEDKPRPTKTADTIAQEWDDKIRALQTELLVVERALDQAGNSLASAVATNREAWRKPLVKLDKEAVAKLAEADKIVQKARAQISLTRSSADWLDRFSLGEVQRGDLSPFHGGQGGVSAASNDALIEPRPELRHYRGGVPIYSRYDLETLRDVYEFADGTPIGPEIEAELTSVIRTAGGRQ